MIDPANLANLHLKPATLVIAGVSGGPDSLAMLHFLHALGYPLLVATFDHHLRPGAHQELEFVRTFAQKLGLSFVSGEADVAAHAAACGLSIEEAARELRYRFLFNTARQAAAGSVVVGHTADDQAETVLMHFLRGAGLSGLKGMPPSIILPVFDPHIPLVRPLLEWTRADTEAYCRLHGLEPRIDPTNADTRYFRNRLRHELLPILETYNPQIRKVLSRTALALQGDHELLEALTVTAWQDSVKTIGPGFIEFELSELKKMTPALARSLFRRAAFLLKPGLRDVDFEVLQRAAGLRSVDLAGGLKTLLENNSLFLTSDEAALPSDAWPQLDAPFLLSEGHTRLLNGWLITCQEVTAGQIPPGATTNPDRFTVWLDARFTGDNLRVRALQSGDRFEPLGMPRQTVKLTDLFINLKVPKRYRSKWPLVCAGDIIVWVPGLRQSEAFKLTKKTAQAVRIGLTKETGQA
ncbi:MAG TPA: tRNA lysidine(34) synthetase TilS [Anaerolineales bacterium]|jgi:tRNA(Ile)-lysidine synthase